MLVRAFEIHHGIFAAVTFAHDAGELRKLLRVFQHEGVGRARIEPDVENVVHLLEFRRIEIGREKTRAILVGEPCVGTFFLEGIHDAFVHALVDQRFAGIFIDEHCNRHAPGALARDHPVRAVLDHAIDAVLARLRHPFHVLDALQCEAAERGIERRDFLVHRDEPLRGVAIDHRLLRAP